MPVLLNATHVGRNPNFYLFTAYGLHALMSTSFYHYMQTYSHAYMLTGPLGNANRKIRQKQQIAQK